MPAVWYRVRTARALSFMLMCVCVRTCECSVRAVTTQSNHFCEMIICQNYINVASLVKYSIFFDVDVCVCVRAGSFVISVCMCVGFCVHVLCGAVCVNVFGCIVLSSRVCSYIGSIQNKEKGMFVCPLAF